MNETQIEKLKRFNADKVMNETVRQVILETFLRPDDYDRVEMKAASRIAIDKLYDAWKELNKYAQKESAVQRNSGPVGL